MTGSRIGAARDRVVVGKVVLAAGGIVVFAAAMTLARVSQAGHAKQRLQPLAAPPAFVAVVRRDLLQAGVLAPASAPADAATSVS